jgi:hypothetical protein
MIVTALPKGQAPRVRNRIERQIAELEARIVPGLKASTVQMFRDQIHELESQLKPADDKRNPAYYRSRRKPAERIPVMHWNASDYAAAKWGARQRSAGVCEICRDSPHEVVRIHTVPLDADICRDHVECVCLVCADQFPRVNFPHD